MSCSIKAIPLPHGTTQQLKREMVELENFRWTNYFDLGAAFIFLYLISFVC